MSQDDFATMLAIAHERLILLDDLKQTNESITWMRGFMTGMVCTVIGGLFWYGLWRLL